MLWLTLFGMMVVAHALCDYPLQGDFLAKAKNRAAEIVGVPWYQAMTAHSIIHGAAVWFISGSLVLGLCEVLAHFVIDDLKCTNRISFNADQALHIACKALWTSLMFLGV